MSKYEILFNIGSLLTTKVIQRRVKTCDKGFQRACYCGDYGTPLQDSAVGQIHFGIGRYSGCKGNSWYATRAFQESAEYHVK